MNLERTPYLAIALWPLGAKLKATIARALFVLTVAAVPTMVCAASIISASTPGQYNAGLGTLLDTTTQTVLFRARMSRAVTRR